MKKYLIIGGLVTFVVIFNLGYVFHEIIAGDFFKEQIGSLQRESYNIPLIAAAFVLYVIFQAYFLHVYYTFSHEKYKWSLTKAALVFGTIAGFLWDGLQGGIIEVATFKMPMIVFWVDSGYHTLEGVITALILSWFYKRFVISA